MSKEDDVARAIGSHGFRDFAVKICHKNGKQCKYGFVNFQSVEKCQEAYESLKDGFLIHGRRIRIRYGGSNITDVTPFNSHYLCPTNVAIHSIHVRFCTTSGCFDESKMISFFAAYGTIVDVCITEVEKVS